ncbi:MAG: LCP family protein [Chloroflexi bacterium]|nr:LCP family protein [Chloroflexota bacterium]
MKSIRWLALIAMSALALIATTRMIFFQDNDPLFTSLLKPVRAHAQQRRAERAQSDPQFARRIDRDLNAERINILLFGYGETHEPPLTERAIIGSFTLLAYDTRTGQADLISMTHDIRAPEVERLFEQRNGKTHALKMDRAYEVGGFALMRETIENATGLAIDFQIVFRDRAIQRVVDDVFRGIEIDVPVAFAVQPFYLDGEKFPQGFFAPGKQMLNGRQVIQFIKTVPVAEGLYDPALEHNARKHLVFQGLLDALNQQSADRDFWLRLIAFARDEMNAQNIALDFDPLPLVVNNIGAMLPGIEKLIAQRANVRLPTIHATTYIVDPAHGDGGVQWVNANADVNPITRRDIDAGIYPNLDYEVPIDANPYGDLVSEYWRSTRALVRRVLLTGRAAE